MDKKFYKSKTFWAGVITIVVGVLQTIQGQLAAGTEISVMGIVFVILRLITNQGITK